MAKRKKKEPVTSTLALWDEKRDAYDLRLRAVWDARSKLKAAEVERRAAEREMARAGLSAVRAGYDAPQWWIVHWWNNFETSPRESRGLPCVHTVAEIPADAEPLPEPEGK